MRSRSPSPAVARHPRPSWGPRSHPADSLPLPVSAAGAPAASTSSSSHFSGSSLTPARSLPPPPPPLLPPPLSLPRWDRAGPASSSANATVSTAPNRWTAAAKAGAQAAASGGGAAQGLRASSTSEDGPVSVAYSSGRFESEPRYKSSTYGSMHPDGPARGGPMPPPSSVYNARRRSPSPPPLRRDFRSPSPAGPPSGSSYGAVPNGGGGSYSSGPTYRPPPPAPNGGPYPPPGSRISSASSSTSSAPLSSTTVSAAGGSSSLPPFLPQRPNFSPPRKRPYGDERERERDDFSARSPPSADYPYRDDLGGGINGRSSWERDRNAPSSSSASLPLTGGLRRQHPMVDDWGDRRRESDAREKDRLERDHRERDGGSASASSYGPPPGDYGSGRRTGGGLPPYPSPLNGPRAPHPLSPPPPPRRSVWPERFAPGKLPPSSSVGHGGPPADHRPLPPHLASSAGLPPRRRSGSPPSSYRREPYDRSSLASASPATIPQLPPPPSGVQRSNTRFSSPYPAATAAASASVPAVNGRVSYPPPPHLLPRFGPSTAVGVNGSGSRSSYPAPPPSTFSPYTQGGVSGGGAGGGPDHEAGRGESISLDYRESRSPEQQRPLPLAPSGHRRTSTASSTKRTASPPPTLMTGKRQPGTNQWERPGSHPQHKRSSSIASANGANGGDPHEVSSAIASDPVKQEATDRDDLPLPAPSTSTVAVGGWADVLTGPDGRRRPLPPPVVAPPSSSSSAYAGRAAPFGSGGGRQTLDRPVSPPPRVGSMGPPAATATPVTEIPQEVSTRAAVDDEKEEGEEDESTSPQRTKSLLERLSSPPPLLAAAAARPKVPTPMAEAPSAPLSPPRSASPPVVPVIAAPTPALPAARQTATPPPPPVTAADVVPVTVEPPQSPDHHSPQTPPEPAGEEMARVVGPVSPESAHPAGGGEVQAEEKVQVVVDPPADTLNVLRADILLPTKAPAIDAVAIVAPTSPVKPEPTLTAEAKRIERSPPASSLPSLGLPTSEGAPRRSNSRSPSRELQTLLNPDPEPMVSPLTSEVAETVVTAAVGAVEPMDVDVSAVEIESVPTTVVLPESSEAMDVDEPAAEATPPAATNDYADDDADMSSVSRSSLTQDEILDLVKAHVVSHARAAAGRLLSEGEIGQIIGFNACLVDPVSSRLPRPAKVKEAVAVAGPSYKPSVKPLKVIEGLPQKRQAILRAAVAQRIEQAIASEAEHLVALRDEYRTLNIEWTASCARLDRVTEKRKAAKRPAANPHARTPSVYTPGGTGSTPSQGTGLGGFDDFRPGRTSRSTRGNYPEQGYFQDVVRSEAEFQSILASLGDADYLDPNLRAARTAAVVPDMVRDPMARERDAYDDSNGLVLDPDAFYEISTSTDVWTDEERQIFAKKFASHPKQFGKIADALPHKTADQCVLYYYRNKKSINFRAIISSGGSGRRKGRRAGKASRLMANLEGKQKKARGGAADQPLSARDGDETAPPSPLAPTVSAAAAVPNPSSATPASTSRKRKQSAPSNAADKSSLAAPSSTAKSSSISPAGAVLDTPTAPPRPRNGKSLLGSLMNPSPVVPAAATTTTIQPPPLPPKAASAEPTPTLS